MPLSKNIQKNIREKRCTLCNLYKDVSLFYLKRGFLTTSRCKDCLRQKRSDYVKNNYNKVLILNRERYHRLKEKNLWDGPKLYRERAFKDGLDGFLATNCKGCLKRKGGDIDWKFLRELWESQSGLCALSGTPMTFISGEGKVPTNISVDRINNNGIYTKDNVRLVCTSVNMMKGVLTDYQLIDFCNKIIKYHANKK
jgi:hypothetical protein